MKLTALLAALIFAAAAAQSAVPPPDYIAKAVADSSRPADNRKLDPDRKPAEVIAFAGVHPGEVVGEFLPGGGYYTRLLSDVVGPHGKVYALETTTWGQGNVDAVIAITHEPGHANVAVDASPLGSFTIPEKIDLFGTTLNYHDLRVPKYATVDMAAFNRRVWESLKPGGIYFIVDHAAASGTGASLSPTLHRIDKATVIQEVTAAGFKLVGESDLLANPADDHSKVVFDPTIRMKTDQFILKFKKI